MNQRIIYPTETGGVAIVIPAEECGLSIEEIAVRVVPEGVPFKIVDISEIPEDRTFRNAWEYDDSEQVTEDAPVKDTSEEE